MSSRSGARAYALSVLLDCECKVCGEPGSSSGLP